LHPDKGSIFNKSVREGHRRFRIETVCHIILRLFEEINVVEGIRGPLVLQAGVVQDFISLHTLDEETEIQIAGSDGIRDTESEVRLSVA